MMISILGNLIGGIGLLLIGISLMTDGLKLASGNALRNILAQWTSTRLRGLFAGFFITGVVQSSSAVTVATIGFANAEMLTLERAIWIIYGSNVGTTLTAWMVVLAGFSVNIEALALPLIGLGALLKITGNYSKRSSFGMALVGFGLLFLGISFLKDIFDSIGSNYSLPLTADTGLRSIALYVLIGAVLTVLMQSSTATMVLALSATAGGVLPLAPAAAVVIGANLGSTSTAIIATFGATATARRVAISHVAFNLLAGIVAALLLEPLLQAVNAIASSLQRDATPALALAIFHTLFNIGGVLLIWPLSNPLTAYLRKCLVTPEELSSRPRHLDKTLLSLPYIATDALALEVERINRHTIIALRASLNFSTRGQRLEERRIVRRLADEVGSYAADLSRNLLTPFLSATLANLIESTQQYLLVIDIAEDISGLNEVPRQHFQADITAALKDYIACLNRHLDVQDLGRPDINLPGTESYDEVERYYRLLKDAILRVAARGEMDMVGMDQLLQFANQAKRASRQILKATQRLLAVRQTLQQNRQKADSKDMPAADGGAQPAPVPPVRPGP